MIIKVIDKRFIHLRQVNKYQAKHDIQKDIQVNVRNYLNMTNGFFSLV